MDKSSPCKKSLLSNLSKQIFNEKCSATLALSNKHKIKSWRPIFADYWPFEFLVKLFVLVFSIFLSQNLEFDESDICQCCRA